MRRFLPVIPGLLLVLGSASAGAGHVHAAPGQARARGLHADHVHFDSGHGAHHSGQHHHRGDRDAASGISAGHEGGDAVALNWEGYRATPKRPSPCLAASSFPDEPPETVSAETHNRSGAPLRDPPPHARPPGRAPPV